MKTYDHSDPRPGPARAHPWRGARGDPSSRYFDFKKKPALIRTSLEDLRPWAAWPAIDTFYCLLEWLNGADSILESNDCAFTGPCPNETPRFTKKLEATGRLMILWRDLPLNLSKRRTEWLKGAIHRYLHCADAEFEWGAVGITLFRARYLELPQPEERRLGYQLMLSFWSWGDSEEEVMTNLDRTFQNIWVSLREVVREVKESNPPNK